MTALPRRMYRDPAEQLLEAEAETCKGCKHARVSAWDQGYPPPIPRCNNPRSAQILADKRCEEYDE